MLFDRAIMRENDDFLVRFNTLDVHHFAEKLVQISNILNVMGCLIPMIDFSGSAICLLTNSSLPLPIDGSIVHPRTVNVCTRILTPCQRRKPNLSQG